MLQRARREGPTAPLLDPRRQPATLRSQKHLAKIYSENPQSHVPTTYFANALPY
jgi:hypothetical protein